MGFWRTGAGGEKIGGGIDVVVDGILIGRGEEEGVSAIGFADCDGLINSAVRPAPTEALAAAISIVDFDIVVIVCDSRVDGYNDTEDDDERNIKISS